MNDTNYIISVVKILEKPVQTLTKSNRMRIDCRVQVAQTRGIQIAHLIFWDNFESYNINDFQINNYILVEGYLDQFLNSSLTLNKKLLKKSQITILKMSKI